MIQRVNFTYGYYLAWRKLKTNVGCCKKGIRKKEFFKTYNLIKDMKATE